MPSYTLYHNPRCSKSRQTLARLQEAGVEPTLIKYLEEPPSAEQIQTLLGLLGYDHPRQLMRTGEKEYRELGLKTESDPAALITAMAGHPRLIQRPILVKDNGVAVLGRPPENVDRLI